MPYHEDAQEPVAGAEPGEPVATQPASTDSAGEPNETCFCSACDAVVVCRIKIVGADQQRIAQCLTCGYRWSHERKTVEASEMTGDGPGEQAVGRPAEAKGPYIEPRLVGYGDWMEDVPPQEASPLSREPNGPPICDVEPVEPQGGAEGATTPESGDRVSELAETPSAVPEEDRTPPVDDSSSVTG